MRIHTRDTILHGRIRLEQDETYDVPDELGRRFVAQGWATSDEVESGERSADPVEIDPDDVVHIMKES